MSARPKSRSTSSHKMVGVQFTPQRVYSDQIAGFAGRGAKLPPSSSFVGPAPLPIRPVFESPAGSDRMAQDIIGNPGGWAGPIGGSAGDDGSWMSIPEIGMDRPLFTKPGTESAGGPVPDIAGIAETGGFVRLSQLPTGGGSGGSSAMQDAIAGIAGAIPGQLANAWANQALGNSLLSAAPGGPLAQSLKSLGIDTPFTSGPLAGAMENIAGQHGLGPAIGLLPAVADVMNGGSPAGLAGAIGGHGLTALLGSSGLGDLPGGSILAGALGHKLGSMLGSGNPLDAIVKSGCFDPSAIGSLTDSIAAGVLSPAALGQMLSAAGIDDIPGVGQVANALGSQLQDALAGGLGNLGNLDLGSLADSIGGALTSAQTMNQLLAEAGLGDIPGMGAVGDALSDELNSLIDGNALGDSIDLSNIAANALDQATDQLLSMWQVDDNASALEHIAHKMVTDNQAMIKGAIQGLIQDPSGYASGLSSKIDKFFGGETPGAGLPAAHVGDKDDKVDVGLNGFGQVLVGGMPIARMGDLMTPSMKKVLDGSSTVLSGLMPTARVSSATEIPSQIAVGVPTVLVGVPGGTGGTGSGAASGSNSAGDGPAGPESPSSASSGSGDGGGDGAGQSDQAERADGIQGDNAERDGDSPGPDDVGAPNPPADSAAAEPQPEVTPEELLTPALEESTDPQQRQELAEALLQAKIDAGQDPGEALDEVAGLMQQSEDRTNQQFRDEVDAINQQLANSGRENDHAEADAAGAAAANAPPPAEEEGWWDKTKGWVSGGLDFVPVAGNVKSGVECVTGKDYIGDRELSPAEQALACGGVLLPAAKKVGTVIDVGKGALKLGDKAVDASKQLGSAAKKKGGEFVEGAKETFDRVRRDESGALFPKKIRELNPKHSEDVIQQSNKVQADKLKKMSDDELLETATNPKDGQFIIENTKTGKLQNGNTRAQELKRRAKDPNSKITENTEVPVEPYTPDNSAFPDLD